MLDLSRQHNNELSQLYFQDNFFVITSEDVVNNCALGGEVEHRLYGYAILEDRIYINSRNCNFPFPMDTCGSFVNVVSNGNSIEIYQDYFGSYGLYLYSKDGYWAISNAFLFLAEYLRDKKHLSIDSIYAMTMIAPPTSSLAYKRTLIKEIEMLPRDCYVRINKQSGQFSIIRQKQKESYIPIESREAVELLDKWHRKWNRLFQALTKRNLMFSLSGGKDSRASLTCLFSPRIDMDKVSFYSQKDTLSTHADDYCIAKEIAGIYNFHLHGQDIRFERYLMDPWDQLKAMLFIKGGFNREIMPFHFYQQQPVFRITGSGGDLRELWSETPESFIKKQLGAISFHSLNVREALKEIMEETKQQIDEDYQDLYSNFTATEYFYRYGRQRNHNGKANVEVFMGNTVILSPLMDPLLYKINQDMNDGTDRDLLYALIYERYVPELDAVPFDSNRIVIEPTKAKAKEINAKYPFKLENETLSRDFGLSIGKRIPPMRYEGNVRALDCLRELFESEDMKQAICTEYGEEIYEWATNYWAHKPWHPYMPAAALTAFYSAYSAAYASSLADEVSSEETREDAKESSYFNDGITKEILDYLQAARIEIKNIGSESNTVVLDKCDDENLFMESPKWFKDDKGEGKLFQSQAGKLVLDFHAVGDGMLKISLKGPWIRDSQGKPLPIKVDFRKIVLNENGNNIIESDDVTTVDISKPVMLEGDCSDGMQYSLCLEWFPYIYSPDEFCNLYREMRTNFVDFFKFWKH